MQASIILTYDGDIKDFEKSLFSAANQEFNKDQFEVLVVGKNCSDVSGVIKKYHNAISNVKCIAVKYNFNKAKNMAIKQAKGKYIFLMECGVIIRRNSLAVSCVLHENSSQDLIIAFKPFLLSSKESIAVDTVQWFVEPDLIITKLDLDEHTFEMMSQFWKDDQFISFPKVLATEVNGINEKYYKEDKVGNFIDRMIEIGGILINPHIMCFKLHGKKSKK